MSLDTLISLILINKEFSLMKKCVSCRYLFFYKACEKDDTIGVFIVLTLGFPCALVSQILIDVLLSNGFVPKLYFGSQTSANLLIIFVTC